MTRSIERRETQRDIGSEVSRGSAEILLKALALEPHPAQRRAGFEIDAPLSAREPQVGAEQ